MNRTIFVRIVSICLVLLMCTAVFAACGTPTPSVTDTTAGTADTTVPVDTTVPAETEPEETAYPGPVIEEDLNGKTIRILVSEPRTGSGGDFPYSEVYYDSEAGDIINDAIFKRNAQITEKYGVTIEGIDAPNGVNGLHTLERGINAGNDDYHAVTIAIRYLMNAAQRGLLANVSELPYLDPEAPWYYQKIRDQLSIAEAEYLLVGYFNMRAFDTMSFMAYNKPMVERYSLGDLNQLALDGKWTLDAMREMATKVAIDVDNDGKVDGNVDETGIISHSGYILTFFIGMGGTFVDKDAEGLPYYVGLDEKNERLLSTITDFLYSEPASLHALSTDPKLIFESSPFVANRQLFAPMLVYGMRELSEDGADYGILPFPKADELQENYISPIHSGHASGIAIPNNNSDIDSTAAVVAELMHYSYEIIYPAHVQRAMELRYSPEENSTEMLRMLFGTLCVEMSTAMELSVDSQLRTMGGMHLNNFAAVFKSLAKSNTTLVENYVKGFTGE